MKYPQLYELGMRDNCIHDMKQKLHHDDIRRSALQMLDEMDTIRWWKCLNVFLKLIKEIAISTSIMFAY